MTVKKEGRNDMRKETYLYWTLCVVTLAVTLIPISRNYVMNGGLVTEWIARVKELDMGMNEKSLYLFPQNTEVWVNAINSNLWFFIPALIYRLFGDMAFAYRAYMLTVQAGTFLTAWLLFGRIFAKEETKLSAFFGVLLYMTCPYRIYVCYDLANLSQAAAWMLLPLYIWAIAGIMEGNKKVGNVVAAAFALAGTGYADVIFFVTALGLTLLAAVAARRFWLLVSMAGGMLLFLPGLYRLIRYLFLGDYQEWGLPLHSIMAEGYRVGQFFHSYSFREGHPGIGWGMFFCLSAVIWLGFVEGVKETNKGYQICMAAGCFFMVISTRYFPWEIVQRLGTWALKLVCLIETPAIFWGMAFLCFCIPGAHAMEKLSRHENKMIAYAIPFIVLMAAIGICVYQCNVLVYHRFPLGIS